MGEVINVCKILVGNLKRGEHMQDICVDGREVLKWVLRRWEASIQKGHKKMGGKY